MPTVDFSHVQDETDAGWLKRPAERASRKKRSSAHASLTITVQVQVQQMVDAGIMGRVDGPILSLPNGFLMV
jgi:hypothetical protein